MKSRKWQRRRNKKEWTFTKAAERHGIPPNTPVRDWNGEWMILKEDGLHTGLSDLEILEEIAIWPHGFGRVEIDGKVFNTSELKGKTENQILAMIETSVLPSSTRIENLPPVQDIGVHGGLATVSATMSAAEYVERMMRK